MMSSSLVGCRVDWKTSFRDYTGVIVRHTPDCVDVYELYDQDVYNFKANQQHILSKNGYAIAELVKYHRKDCTERSEHSPNDAEMHSYVLEQLQSVHTKDAKLHALLCKAIEEQKRQLEQARYLGEDEIDTASPSKGDAKGRKSPKKKGQSKQHSPKQKSNGKQHSPKKGGKSPLKNNTGKLGGDEYLKHSASLDEEQEGSEEEDSEEDEDDEDGSEEDSDEEDDEDEEEDDDDEDNDDEDDEDESSEEEEEEKVNVKVFVMASQDVRGYCIHLTKSGLNTLKKKLHKDYKSELKLFFRDEEGDIINILSSSDLAYAYSTLKAANRASQGASNSVDNLSSPRSLTLKLFAELVGKQQSASSTMDMSDASTPARTNRSRSHANGHDQQADSFLHAGYLGVAPVTLGHGVSAASIGHDFDVIWKKGDMLGTGSFGKVYSGINLTNGERMAVKEVYFSDDKRSAQQARALQREVQILSTLQHINIVRYIGTEISGNTLRIFLEFATDGTLKDALNEFGPFPEPLLRHYTVDILQGLSYLHELKMIHRDIKPANLLISNGIVKLADFGCSSSTSFKDDSAETDHFTVVGTTIYMAPEVMQAGGSEANSPVPPIPGSHSRPRPLSPKRAGYGRKADIWSLGMTLYELSTGSAPYKSAAAAIYAVCVSKKVPEFPKHYSEVAHHFLARCVEIDPELRAACGELKEHVFTMSQGLEEARAQTAANAGHAREVNWSTVKANMPTELAFSPDSKAARVHADGDSSMTGLDGAGTWEGDSAVMTARQQRRSYTADADSKQWQGGGMQAAAKAEIGSRSVNFDSMGSKFF